MSDAQKTLYMVNLQVGDVPPEFYKENGQKEITYTQGLIREGVVQQLLVTMNRRQSWMLIAADDEAALTKILDGFPLRPYFTLEHHAVRNVGQDVMNAPAG